MKYRLLRSVLILLLAIGSLSAQDNMDLFKYWSYYSDVENSLYKYFCDVAFEQLEKRSEDIGRLKTKEDWLGRQIDVKARIYEILGDLPSKTPLNIKVTGIIQRSGYRVEKLIYESRPGYYVTAALFIPDELTGPAPAILNPIGHSPLSFRRDVYQHTIINLVQKGFVVLAYDPIGQGERMQYYDDKIGKSVFPTNHEHSYPGAQCFISGYSPAKYFIWDGIRGLDVLESRPEVDPKRLGMTGISGGGVSTAQICVFDDRIVAAAPECYITNYSHLFRSEGPQDAEQNLVKFIQRGLDHPDFLELRAPRPTLVMSTTRDFFSIQGAMESFEEASLAYHTLNAGSNLQMTVEDARHSFTKKNREAMYAFFQKHLNNPGDPIDYEIDPISEEELQVTATGQLSTSLGGETMHSLNRRVVERQVMALEEKRRTMDKLLSGTPDAAQRISGFTTPEEIGSVVFSGRTVGESYVLEKYLLGGSGDYMLPLVLCLPKGRESEELVLLLHEKGKDFAMNQDSLARTLLHQGYAVMLADLPDIGEMGPGYLRGDTYIRGVSYNKWFAGILTGKSIVGLRAMDIVRISKMIRSDLPQFKMLTGISVGQLGSELLHAATFTGGFNRLCLIEPIQSFVDIALSPDYKPEFIHSVVPGAIEEYDLPDLMASFAPRPLLVLNPLKANGALADPIEAEKNLKFPRQVYSHHKSDNNWNLQLQNKEDTDLQVLKWLRFKD